MTTQTYQQLADREKALREKLRILDKGSLMYSETMNEHKEVYSKLKEIADSIPKYKKGNYGSYIPENYKPSECR